MNQQPRHLVPSLILLSLTVLLGLYALPLVATPVQAVHGGDDWAPQGPYYDRILVQIFAGSEPSLFLALQNGELDLTDWAVPRDSVNTICNDPNLQCEFVSELGMFGLDFNHNPRNNWFGVISGADEQAVTEILRAIAHLVDKDEHIQVTIGGFADRLDAVLPGFPLLWGQPFDSLHQGPQTVQNETALGTANTITVRVLEPGTPKIKKPGADVYLIHITGDKNKEGVLGDYAALCRDGGICVAASRRVGGDFKYETYADAASDGQFTFRSRCDPATVVGARSGCSTPPVKQPLPAGTYIVYAVNKDTDFGWGHITYPGGNAARSVDVHTGQPLSTGGNYNNVLYPSAGYEEFCEARDHLVGIHTDITGDGVPDTPFKDSNNDCRIDKDSAIFSAVGFTALKFYVRQDVNRSGMGLRLADRMRTLFGGNDVMPAQVLPVGDIVPIVFFGDPIDDWNAYTGGWSLSRDFDYIDDLYNPIFAYAPCGNVSDPEFTTNYGSTCNDLFGSAARAAKNTFDAVAAKLATFLHNFILGFDPVWTVAGFQAYHNAWTGVINAVGTGIRSLQSVLNMYPVKDCARHGKLLFTDLNGDGCWQWPEPLTMRWSFLNDVRQLNPLQSQWLWDFFILGLVYDSLQNINPYSLQEDYGALASSWTNFENPTASQLGYEPLAGTALTQRWFVKNHIGFSDGKAMTGKDVAFSMLSYKEIQSPGFLSTVDPITYVRIVSDVPQQIVVDVGMSVNAPQFRAGHIAGILPVMPCNVFSTGNPGFPQLPNCGGITTGTTMPAVVNGNFSGAPLDITFDPTFVADEDGDGLPESHCGDLGSHRTGQKGTGPFILECSSSGTSTPGFGGQFVLRRHTVDKSTFAKSREYWASPHNYLVWRWADFNNNGVVGTDDKARTRLNPPIGCRNKAVQTNQALWDQNGDGVPDDTCTQFDFNRNGVSSDFSDRARMTLEGNKRWTVPCVWPWPGGTACAGGTPPGYRTVAYPWVGWVWWIGHQCLGPDRTKGTADDDKTACWFTKFASRPP